MNEIIRQLTALADARYQGDTYGMICDWANDAQEELDEVSGTGDTDLDNQISAIVGDTNADDLLAALDTDGTV